MKPPFLFVGAGSARYFELATLSVCFERSPDEAERTALLEGVPPLLAEQVAWQDEVLALSSEQRLGHLPVGAEARAFHAATERWLKSAHRRVPILLVLRLPDAEAGGTAWSAWHRASVAALDDAAARLGATDPATAAGRMVDDALALAAEERALPPSLAARLSPDLLPDALRRGELARIDRALRGPDPESVARTLVAALDPGVPADRRALLDAENVLARTRPGFDALLRAAALDEQVWRLDGVLRHRHRFVRDVARALIDAAADAPPEVAVAVLETGLAREDARDDPGLVSTWAFTLLVHGRAARASDEALEHALRLAATTPEIGVNATGLLLEQRRYERVVAWFDAQRGGPIDGRAHLNEAQALAHLGRWDDAAAAADRALAAGDLGGHLLHAARHLHAGEGDRARAAVERARVAGYPFVAAWLADPLLAGLDR